MPSDGRAIRDCILTFIFLSSSVYQQDRREREQQDLELAKEMAEEDDEGF